MYAFTTSYHTDGKQKTSLSYDKGDVAIGGFHLLNLMSSSLKNTDWQEMMSYMMMTMDRHASYSKTDDIFDGYHSCHVSGYGLGGTPLDDCIVTSAKVVEDFRDKYKLQIVNAIFLTDGCTSGSPISYSSYDRCGVWNGDTFESTNSRDKVMVLRDKKTGKIFNNASGLGGYGKTTANLLEWFQHTTGIPAIGIFLTDVRSMSWQLDCDQFDEFKKNKCISLGQYSGYSEYYVICSKTKKFKGVDDLDCDASPVAVKNAFVRESRILKTQQNIMNQFVEKISKETI